MIIKRSIFDMSPEEVVLLFEEFSLPSYRASQVLQWVWKKGAGDFACMTNLPIELRDRLGGVVSIGTSSLVGQSVSDDGTRKLAIRLFDGELIESVMIPSSSRRTACISTQVGCGMGCVFCASALGGFKRNLTSGEILEQILLLEHHTGEKITHVVFMGIGEPLANFGAAVRAIEAIVDRRRLAISARRVTVSTVGLVDEIIQLSEIDYPITLAISLHASNDVLRRELIPSARGYSIDDIIEAARVFFAAHKREVTLEYILIAGVNDTSRCAADLANIAHQIRCNINLIRYNPIDSLEFLPPTVEAVRNFASLLQGSGVNVQVRQSRGCGITAACGQLRRKMM